MEWSLCHMMDIPENDPESGMTQNWRRSLVSGAVLVLLALGYGGFWLYSTDHIMDYLEKWTEPPGNAVSWQSMSATGFPFRLSITLENPTATDPHGNQWSTDRAYLHMRPWDWTTFTLNAPHTQDFVVNDGGGETRTFRLDTHELDGVFSLLPDRAYAATITAINARLRDDRDQTLTVDDIRINAGASPHTSPDPTRRSAYLWFTLTGIQSAGFASLLLGERIEKMSGEIELFGPLPVPLKTAQLSRWRDAGGIVEVRSLRLTYGPLNLHTEGTLALDDDLQPVGAFTARMRGFHETLDALQQTGVMDSRETLTAKLVLGALAQTDSMTGQRTLNLPISIQDRSLYAGPLKLGKIPPVIWPD